MLLCLAAVGSALPREAQASAVEREWLVRSLALEEGLHGEALLELLGAEDWRQREAGWDALGRSLALGMPPSPPLQGALELGLCDEHPGVRRAALECLALWNQEFELDAGRARELSREAWPDLRMALLVALERVRCSVAGELSHALLSDGDLRVTELAERVLWGLEAGAANSGLKLERLLSLIAQGASAEGELKQALDWLWHSEPDPHLQAALRSTLERSLAPGEWTHWRSLLTAIELAQGNALSAQRLEHLLAGWVFLGRTAFVPSGLPEALSHSLEPRLAKAWLMALDAVQRGQQARLPWPELQQASRVDLDPEAGLLRDVLRCAGAGGALRLALDLELSPGLCSELLDEIGSEVEAWSGLLEDPRLATWWAPDAPLALRLSLIGAASRSLFQQRDAGAAQLLVQALSSGDHGLHHVAFQSLAKAELEEAASRALAEDWMGLDPAAKRRCAAWLPRGRALPHFRMPLIKWGASRAERSQALELLAAFVGDEELLDVMGNWLEQDFQAFCLAQDAPDHERLEAQGLVQAELRALTQVARGSAGEEASLERVAQVLLESFGQSASIGRTAAIQLGRGSVGRGLLGTLLQRELHTRARVEACMALLLHGPAPRGVDLAALLITDFASVDEEARVPLITALGSAASLAALEFLQRLAASSDNFSERVAALHALSRVRPEQPTQARRGLEFLQRVCLEAPELEYRRVAIAALASGGEFRDLVWLVEEFLPELLRQDPKALGLAGPGRALLRAEILERAAAAWLRRWKARESAQPSRVEGLQRVAERLAGLLLERCMAGVDSRLQARFLGRELGALEFEWRGELALARALGEGRCLARALEAWPQWRRLDGELLLALARAAKREPELEAQLLRAALVALLPERGAAARAWRAEARLALLFSTWRMQRWAQCARLARGLRLDMRAGLLPRTSTQRALGLFDPRAGVDPEAQLACLELLAAGHAALESGLRTRAVEQLKRASQRAGRSRWAEAECQKLKALLGGD